MSGREQEVGAKCVSIAASRRAFILGRPTRPAPIRPHGAVGEDSFTSLCNRCNACAEVCEPTIIVPDADGFPTLDFLAGACTFCGACADACESGALLTGQVWSFRARVGDACLSRNGVACRTCEDQCDTQTIRFRLLTGGRAEPRIDLAACTGCGACVAPCPAGAISLFQPQPEPKDQPC